MNIVLLLQIFILLPGYVLQTAELPYTLGAMLYVILVLLLSFNTEYGNIRKEHNTLGWSSIISTILLSFLILVGVVFYFIGSSYINVLLIIKYLTIVYYLVSTVALGSLFEKEKGAFDLVLIMVFGSINALTCFFFIQIIFETVSGHLNLLL